MASLRGYSARIALIAVFIASFMQIFAPVTAAASSPTQYDLVYAVAHSKMGDQWKERGRGPNVFDCSGLIWYAFHQNGLQGEIGGYRSVAGYFNWFKQRGLVSKSNPQLGDLVVWGNNQHIGLYIGNGQAISTLITKHGVSIHPVQGYLGIKLKAYLHTQITRPSV
jgi:cell wall-associated NlpC family hydrolase